MTELLLKRLDIAKEISVERLKENCPFGLKYFCNGKVNKSQLGRGEKLKERAPCIYYLDGKCRNERVRLPKICE